MAHRKRLEQTAGVRLTERDHAIVRVVCEQAAVAAEDLGLMMSPTRQISPRTRNGVLKRLCTVGLVTAERWQYRGSAAVFPTKLGAAWVDWAGPVQRPGFGVLRHELSVSAVRIHAYPAQLGWRFISERRLASEHPTYRHRPDGVAVLGSQRVAIEVQLSVTTQARIVSVISDHLAEFDRVTYWCRPGAQSLVDRAVAAGLSSADAHRVHVHPLAGCAR